MNEQAKQDYQNLVNQTKPKPTLAKNVLSAFAVGGAICLLGELITNFFISAGFGPKEAAGPTSAVLVFLGAFFTGLGIYDELGKYAGAGSIVPITGFANSIVAPAMEFKREGWVFGVGAKMFTIAGPVLVYGMLTAFIVGLLYWLITLFQR